MPDEQDVNHRTHWNNYQRISAFFLCCSCALLLPGNSKLNFGLLESEKFSICQGCWLKRYSIGRLRLIETINTIKLMEDVILSVLIYVQGICKIVAFIIMYERRKFEDCRKPLLETGASHYWKLDAFVPKREGKLYYLY